MVNDQALDDSTPYPLVHHNISTLSGSSGSPLFTGNQATGMWEVIAIHCGGLDSEDDTAIHGGQLWNRGLILARKDLVDEVIQQLAKYAPGTTALQRWRILVEEPK